MPMHLGMRAEWKLANSRARKHRHEIHVPGVPLDSL
jgi:hypothetical protein